jgi:hypothetical protein
MKSCVLLFLLFTYIFTANQAAVAQQADVPISFQIAIIKQIMIVDRIIKSNSDGIILIVKDENSEKKAEIMANVFQKQSIKVEITSDVSSYSGRSVSTIYFFTDKIEKHNFIQKERILTIASNSKLVEDGLVSIAIRNTSSGKPEIVVNKNNIELEGHGELISHLPKAVVL